MITCPKCHKELSDGSQFCDNCGTKIPQVVRCPKCGSQTNSEFAFCQSCGAPISANAPAKRTAKKPPKKAILYGGIGIAVVALLILIICLFFGSKKTQTNYTLYLKENEIFFNDLKKNGKPKQITSNLIVSGNMDGRELSKAGSTIGASTYVSENGKLIFFPDKISESNTGFNLYYKSLEKSDTEASKIDSEILYYSVNSSATIVTYLKGNSRELYQFRIADGSKDLIASNVNSFETSADGKKICFVNSENSIYLKYAGKDKEKIASDITTLRHISDDFTTVYYTKEEALYKQVSGGDKVKIASDVIDVIKIYDSGEIYYFTGKNEQTALMNYVDDDMKEADASIEEPSYPTMPEAPEKPYWWEFEDDDEYNAARDEYDRAYSEWEKECDRLTKQYNDDYANYTKKLSRDSLRNALEENTLDQTNYSLCYYNGSEEIVITNSYYAYSSTIAENEPVISFKAYTQSSIEKEKLSEIQSAYDFESQLKTALFTTSERYIAVKNAATKIEQKKAALSFIINDSGTTAFYIDEIPDEKSYGVLYRIAISKGTVGTPEEYDSDVYTGFCGFLSNTEFKYFKDNSNSNGELYINKKKIDFDVKMESVNSDSFSGQIFYFTDCNEDKQNGTLKLYNGKESIKVADSVHSFTVTPDGRVLYLYEYSMNYYKGDLYEWKNGKSTKLDDDVVYLIQTTDSILGYLDYFW